MDEGSLVPPLGTVWTIGKQIVEIFRSPCKVVGIASGHALIEQGLCMFVWSIRPDLPQLVANTLDRFFILSGL